MTAKTKDTLERWNAALGSPLFQLAGKLSWAIVLLIVTTVGGLALYAGKSKAHEIIASDVAVVEAQVGIKELKASVEAFHIASSQRDIDLERKTNDLGETNKRVLVHLEESTKERQLIIVQLARLQETVQNTNKNFDEFKQVMRDQSARK